MKLQHIMLYTRDPRFDDLLANALFGTGAIVHVVRNVADALTLVCKSDATLDLAVMDFNEGCRGMTLLSAMHVCRESLPTLVVIADSTAHAMAVAYANGAGVCLAKPVTSSELAAAVRHLSATPEQRAAA